MARTLTGPRKAHISIDAIIRESISVGQPTRVDREAGIIFGVKICGKTSTNTHGVSGAQRTEYTTQALQEAAKAYEGMCVNVNHPPRNNPGQDRDAYDRFGWLDKVRVTEAGVFGDLHFLDPKDPLAIKMLNAATLKPDAFALSHNAFGQGQVTNGAYVIAHVPEVRSVDIVAYGGSNRSLFESKEKKTMTLKQLLESLKIEQAAMKTILEMQGMYPDMASTEQPAPPAEAEETYETHLGRTIVAILNDPAMSPDDKKKKVLAAVKLVAGDEPAPVVAEEGDSDGDADDDGIPDDKDKEKDMKESRELRKELAALKAEKAVRELCEGETFAPTKLQFKALLAMDTADRKAFILESKTVGTPKTGPRSTPATRIVEAAQPKDIKEFVSLVTD